MDLKWLAIVGAALAAAGVALGAFGAHGLEEMLRQLGRETSLAKRAHWFETAVKYELYHALGMIAVAALAGASGNAWHRAAGVLFMLGIALFSGSLLTMTFAGDAWRKLGMVTPLGGAAFIAGWLCAAVAAWRS
ncbi:MAG: DUF423 domain-containing protein [Planctomycetota bacterium]|nr:MAG: DUF423 domain-containing protein [Planctomycetota bacterium]